MQDGRLAGMMVMLTYVVHRIVRRGPHLVHADNLAVIDGAAIVPCQVRADGNGFESFSVVAMSILVDYTISSLFRSRTQPRRVPDTA
jgi:hypothetical protein